MTGFYVGDDEEKVVHAYPPGADPLVDEKAYERESVSVDMQQLSMERMRVSAAVAYWSGRLAEATKDEKEAEQELKTATARKFLELKNSKGPDGKWLSVDDRKACCEADKGLFILRQDQILAEAEKLRIRGILDAVKEKSEQLRSLAADQRAEGRSYAPTH